MMKKALSVVLVLLMVIGIVPLAMAETDRNYKIRTEFCSYDAETDEWVPVTTASGGEKLKMRVYIATNYVSGPANFMLAYDKSSVVADLPENGSAIPLELNTDSDFVYNSIQLSRGAHGTKAAEMQYGYGNITDEELEKYSFIVGSVFTYGCVQYDDSDWIFEVDMTVLEGKKGESFECTVLPKTAMTVTNKRGLINFPYAPEASNDLTTVVAAQNWYEGTPVVEAGKISVIANALVPQFYDVKLNANGGLFAGGEEILTVSVEAYEDIPAFEIPARTGYTFAGWDAEIPSTMPLKDLGFTANWQINSYTATFNANGGAFADGSAEKAVSVDYDADIIPAETPEMQGYVFAGWAESENGEIIENLGKMSEQDKTFYAQWIASSDVAYTVETYLMMADGTYNLTTTAYEGTTGETVSYEYVTPEGFEINEEKSVLGGVISADGSLVLKVYCDRKVYKFTTVVNGVQTETEYRYGAEINKPATPVVQGYAFTGWTEAVPSTMPAGNVTLTAKFDVAATVKIKRNPGSTTIKYGETLRLTAETANMPAGAYVMWEVQGNGVSLSQNADGSVCELKSTSSGTVTVTAKVVDGNGNPLSNSAGEISDSQNVTSKAGIWQKIVSFFKNLFGMNRTIIQLFKTV